MKENKLIYPGQTVCVIGLGLTGRAAVRYCLAQGAVVRVSDSRNQEKFLAEEGAFLNSTQIEWEAGEHTYEFCRQSNVLLPSPGIDLRKELFVSLKKSGVTIAGELAVVAHEIEDPMVAVTGTNGKTSVTTLIGDVLIKSGKKVFVGGNIGTPLYEYCLAPHLYDVLVVEVSSFQLETSGAFAPDVAILLNITPDHLDRHGTLKNYRAAKERIFCNQDQDCLAVLNGDDKYCKNLDLAQGVPVATFGRRSSNTLQITETSFLIKKDGDLFDEFSHGMNGALGFSSYNYAAAYLALTKIGLNSNQIANGFLEFGGLPHRLEFITRKNNITFINDSKATNTGAVVGALEEMANRVVLIAGGRGKGEDYAFLRKSIEEKVHTLVLIGETAVQMAESLGDVTDCILAESMEDAVLKAYQASNPGDTVLLSPACASFDMFNSYGNRGDIFKKAVMALRCTEDDVV